MSSLLAQLNLHSANEVVALSAEIQERVLKFLIRWEAYDEAIACLRILASDSAVLLDLFAEALCGKGEIQQAIEVLERRLSRQKSLSAQLQLARAYLAGGRVTAAQRLADELTIGDGGLSPAWSLWGELYLAENNLDAAEEFFLDQTQNASQSRHPMIGLMHVHWRRNNLVGAAAYAVNALGDERTTTTLTIRQLNELRDFFAVTQDENHLREINQRLVSRFDRERAALLEQLASSTPGRDQQSIAPTLTAPAIKSGRSREQTVPRSSGHVDPVDGDERKHIQQNVRRLFGFTSLLPNQAEVIASTTRGENVLAILPTGAGKSLCYQLPAFDKPGITLVVSPLIALMRDQIDGLPAALRRRAIAVNSNLDGVELRRATEEIGAQHFSLVYVAPERLRQMGFIHALRRGGLARMVIDEAHCISVWGHDFRPDYLHIARAHQDLGAPPLLAMTATAPPRVREDIQRQLFGHVSAMRVIAADTFRPNLTLSALRVHDDEERDQVLLNLLTRLDGPGIVYARTRKQCEELAALLRGQGLRAAAYHAGIRERDAIQDGFMRNELSVVVATVAFGMGVDKQDIRFILHYGLPDSIESYYQEIGRAGRNGLPAQCVLLYATHDRSRLERLAARNGSGIDTARAVYGAVQHALKGERSGAVAIDALAERAGIDGTAIRVYLSLLEQAALLVRHYDLPERVTLQRRRTADRSPNLAFVQFTGLTSLDTNSTYGDDFSALAELTAIPLDRLEATLLNWQEARQLSYHPFGRLAHITVSKPPKDVARRIMSLIDQRKAIARQRVQEITAYADTQRCRHGFLAGHLGGTVREQCDCCDHCGAGISPADVADPIVAQATHTVLQTLAEQSWGKRTLVRLLRGAPDTPQRAQHSSSYGRLRDREERTLFQLIDSLLDKGLITARELNHGGVTLELTRLGMQELRKSR